MGDVDLDRLESLLAAAREVVGCSDHHCALRIEPRGGMGTNGGCRCVVRGYDGTTEVRAERLSVTALLALARAAPSLVAEVRRLTAALATARAEERGGDA